MESGFLIATGTTAAASSVITIAGVLGQRTYVKDVAYNPTTVTAGLTEIVVADGATTIYAEEAKAIHLSDPIPMNALFRQDIVCTLDSDTTIVSAGLFTAALVGKTVTGYGIPAGTTVTVFTDVNNITLSAAATITTVAPATGPTLRFESSSTLTITITATGAGNTTGYAIYKLGP